MSPNKKHVAVLVEESYQELEVWYPYYRLIEAGHKVTRLGTGSSDIYPSKVGYPCKVDDAIQNVNANQYDAVIIPGGWAPDYLRRYPAVNQFVADLDKAGKVIASICHGGWVLCSAGILKERRATSFFAIKDDMINAGADWADAEVLVDGNLITSRKPDDLPAFMQAILKALQS